MFNIMLGQLVFALKKPSTQDLNQLNQIPTVKRITEICKSTFGGGLTHENVLKLRQRIVEVNGITEQLADKLSLADAIDFLKPLPKGPSERLKDEQQFQKHVLEKVAAISDVQSLLEFCNEAKSVLGSKHEDKSLFVASADDAWFVECFLESLWRAVDRQAGDLPSKPAIPTKSQSACTVFVNRNTLRDGLNIAIRWCKEQLNTGQSPINHPRQSKPKKSTSKSEATVVLISSLTAHHKFKDGKCNDYTHIAVRELARQAGVNEGTASRLFKKHFGGWEQYRADCRNNTIVVDSTLGRMNRDPIPREMYNQLKGEIQDPDT